MTGQRTACKFVDETKQGEVVSSPDGCAALQGDLDRLENLSRNLGKITPHVWAGTTPCTEKEEQRRGSQGPLGGNRHELKYRKFC